MKRGNLGLLLLLSILFIPFVSAATSNALDIIVGSNDSNMIFLRFMYGALIFLIFLNVSKKSIFKSSGTTIDKNNTKLANVFSLILAIFATRFTPESVVNSFGWFIMVITPLIIYYFLFGIFSRKKAKAGAADEKDGFSWWRLILAALATLLTLSALGKSTYLANMPGIGGGASELFFDVNYFLFDKYLPFLLLAIPIGIILALLFKFGGIGVSKDKDGKETATLPGGIILGLLLLVLLFFLGTFIGGAGLPAIVGLSPWLWYVGGAILGIILLILLIRFFPRLRGWLGGLFGRGASGAGNPSGRLRIDLFANGRSVNSNTFYRRSLLAEPGVNLDIQVIVSRRRWYWFTNQRIPNANLTFAVTRGGITPPGFTADPAGTGNIRFNSPASGTAYLTVTVAPTAATTAYVSPRFSIDVRPRNAPSPSNRIRVDLVANGRTASSINPNILRRSLQAEPSVPLNVQVQVTRRRSAWFNESLGGATLNLSVNSGNLALTTAPTVGAPNRTITTNARGFASIVFLPPAADGTANLNLTVNHASLGAAFVPPTFTINTRSRNSLTATLASENITADLGATATIDVNVRDNRGANVSGAVVNVTIGNRSLTRPFRTIAPIVLPSITTSASGVASFTTPALTALGTFNFSVSVAHASYRRSATASGTITVRDPTAPDMDVRVITNLSSPIPVGIPFVIELSVVRRGTISTPINNANFTFGGATGTAGITSSPAKVRLSNGRYRMTLTPLSSQAGTSVIYNYIANDPAGVYTSCPGTFTVNVGTLSTMNLNITIPSPVSINVLNTIQINVSDSATSANVDAVLSVTSSFNGSAPSPVRSSRINAGNYMVQFRPAVPGNYDFTFTARNGRYSDATETRTITVNPLTPPISNTLSCLAIWAPNPSNKYQLMQIRILNSVTGAPVANASVSIIDSHSNRVNITGITTTNASGSFPTQIRLQPRNPVVASEPHNLIINVTAAGFSPKSSSSPLSPIIMTFDPPGSPLGGISRRNF